MIEGADSNPRGVLDLGSQREQREAFPPCRLRTWCTGVDGHDTSCTDVPRSEHTPIDYGPSRGKR